MPIRCFAAVSTLFHAYSRSACRPVGWTVAPGREAAGQAPRWAIFRRYIPPRLSDRIGCRQLGGSACVFSAVFAVSVSVVSIGECFSCAHPHALPVVAARCLPSSAVAGWFWGPSSDDPRGERSNGEATPKVTWIAAHRVAGARVDIALAGVTQGHVATRCSRLPVCRPGMGWLPRRLGFVAAVVSGRRRLSGIFSREDYALSLGVCLVRGCVRLAG